MSEKSRVPGNMYLRIRAFQKVYEHYLSGSYVKIKQPLKVQLTQFEVSLKFIRENQSNSVIFDFKVLK